jgi:hypothetical protein
MGRYRQIWNFLLVPILWDIILLFSHIGIYIPMYVCSITMIDKRNVTMIAIMAVALTLGAAGLVTSIGQVAYAEGLAEYGIITGFISSHHSPSPGQVINKNLNSGHSSNSCCQGGGGGSGDSGSAAGGK